jgi:DNA adenine methylase
MSGTREQIEERITDLDSSGDHATDAEFAEQFDVTGRWVGEIRHELYEDDKIEATSDFAPQSAKWQAGRDFLKQNPKASTSQVASAVGVSNPTARKIRRDWEQRKEVEYEDWMEGHYVFPYVGSKHYIANWILWTVPDWERFKEMSNEWKQYKQSDPEWLQNRHSASVPNWGQFSELRRQTRLPGHETFVEVFGGSATILLNKPPSEVEVYNDLDDDFVCFFQTLRDHGNEIQNWLEGKPYERQLYDKWEDRWYRNEGWYKSSDRPEDEVKRAAICFYLRFPQYHKKNSGAGYRQPRIKRLKPKRYYDRRDRLSEFQKRFTRDDPEYFEGRFNHPYPPDVTEPVTIENKDYREILEQYDSSNTLFYLDPPYVDKEDYYQDSSGFNHDELVNRITQLEGEFILSYGEVLPDGLEHYRQEMLKHPTAHRLERTIFSYPEDEEGTFDIPTTGDPADEW